MTNIQTLEDIATLSETLGLECKLAAGQGGRGQLPADFWPTYSAFANSRGGIFLLGVQEKQGRFSLLGVDQPERIITDLFNTLNNRQKVSINLLSDQDVSILTIESMLLGEEP
jgi:ATP-dependent DNA helicase RecG